MTCWLHGLATKLCMSWKMKKWRCRHYRWQKKKLSIFQNTGKNKMKVTDNILKQLEECLTTDIYKPLETDKIELKDLSGGDEWKELYKSACAFLNTQGGIIIIGVKETNTAYQFHGFNANNENKLKELPKQFTNDSGQAIDLSESIRPDLFEIRDFMNGRVCIVYVEKLPEDKKYV